MKETTGNESPIREMSPEEAMRSILGTGAGDLRPAESRTTLQPGTATEGIVVQMPAPAILK